MSVTTPEVSTPDRIIDAAFRRLHQDGYARLSTREIAKDAGVNHALIHYYFGTKDNLVMAALDEVNRRLTERQESLYGTTAGFGQKWAQARRFYEDDIASGFVRVQMELWAASLSNEELRREFLPRVLRWQQIVSTAVVEAIAEYGITLPVPSEAVAGLIAGFWWGMEFEMLIGMSDQEAHYEKALDGIQLILTSLDRKRANGSADPTSE